MVARVHVLLATFEGRSFLRQQWASLEAQQGVEVCVHVADDGSRDGTPELLQELARTARGAVRDVHWLDAAPRHSATRSFLQLLAHAVRQHPEAAWFAFCDQDDVWLPGKLAAACEALQSWQDSARPALYAARTLRVDAQDRELGPSPLLRRPPCFRNALVQNVLGGNTMVMNRAAAELVAASADAQVPVHDWFTYQLVTGAGGSVIHDHRTMVRYRQHGSNLVGTHRGLGGMLRRLRRAARADHAAWNAANLAALRRREAVLTQDNRTVLAAFEQARTAGAPWGRVRWLARSGVFRQSAGEQWLLRLACFLGRI